MDPWTAVTTVYRKTFDWSGRAPLSEYWWFVAFAFVCYAVSIGLTVATEGAFPAIIVLLAVAIPQLGAAVRRLHDSGRNGAWYLICLIPLGAFVLLFFLLASGDRHNNQYGPPYDPAEIAAR